MACRSRQRRAGPSRTSLISSRPGTAVRHPAAGLVRRSPARPATMGWGAQTKAKRLRVVTCHLGAGSSLAAVHGGRSVDTTMGFTPLEGLVMATRSGSVDPGLIVWLQRHEAVTERELTEALDGRSGLLGLAGTADMREVLERRSSEDVRARLAFDVYIHRMRACIASMAAAMNGIDALVFTGGVGENSAPVRSEAAAGLRFLGVDVDATSNDRIAGDRDISARGARVRTLVVHAREDVEVARDVRWLLSGSA